jgi:hypothetical protein
MQYCSDAVNNPREKLTAFLRMPRFERIFFSSSIVTGEILYQLNFALSLQTEDIGCAVIFQHFAVAGARCCGAVVMG